MLPVNMHCGPQVGGGGIVRSARVHRQVVADVTAGIEAAGFRGQGCIESPIKGATSGNTEFLAYFRRQRQQWRLWRG